MSNAGKNMQVEGDFEADRQFRDAETGFVKSARGKQKTAGAGNLSGAEAREREAVAENSKARSKGDDSAMRNGSGSGNKAGGKSAR